MAAQTACFAHPFVTATFIQYGTTMLAVQEWEQELAVLVAAASLGTVGGNSKSFERALRNASRRSRKLIDRGKPSAMRNVLGDLVDGDVVTESLIDALSTLNETRNYLAHLYLRSRLPSGVNRGPDHTLVVELLEMQRAFNASTEEMAHAIKALFKRGLGSKRLKHVRASMEQLSREGYGGRPIPLSTRPSDTSASAEATSIKLWERRGS